FLREPEAIFWVFAFPILLALALGIAFRTSGPQKSNVAVESSPDASTFERALATSPDLVVRVLTPEEARTALRRGKIAVLVRSENRQPVLVYDPSRPETRLAEVVVRDALERSAGRVDPLPLRVDTTVRPGSRYIDFLLPGLIGLNLLGTGMWGIG